MMPSITLPSTNTSRGRFELPVLAPLDSLTAGTNIPPPLDSPIEEKPLGLSPKPEPVAISAYGTMETTEYTGRGRTNGPSVPASPVSQTGSSGIRRFLSRKSLHSNYSNGTDGNPSQENLNPMEGRPESPSGFSTASMAGGKRRSVSWFRRIVGGYNGENENKRTSIVFEEKDVPNGPPPPTLPELDQLKAKVAPDAGSLGGDDMFKNIQ